LAAGRMPRATKPKTLLRAQEPDELAPPHGPQNTPMIQVSSV
jgi:hypothetical protein